MDYHAAPSPRFLDRHLQVVPASCFQRWPTLRPTKKFVRWWIQTIPSIPNQPHAEINFERLLWIRCANNLEHAFKATDLLLQGGGFGLVMLDLGDVPAKDAKRIISSWWYRFRRTLEATPTALVVIAEERCVRSCASLALELNREIAYGRPIAKHQIQIFSTGSLLITPRHLPNNPTHSNLISSMQFQISRQKPVHLGAGEAQFRASSSMIKISCSSNARSAEKPTAEARNPRKVLISCPFRVISRIVL